MSGTAELSQEDRKLVILARSARARTGAGAGAAVRDLDGRTYAGATVELPSLSVSALGVCVAMAASSGSRGLEAAVLLYEDPAELATGDLTVLRDFGGEDVVVHLADGRGTVVRSTSSAEAGRAPKGVGCDG